MFLFLSHALLAKLSLFLLTLGRHPSLFIFLLDTRAVLFVSLFFRKMPAMVGTAKCEVNYEPHYMFTVPQLQNFVVTYCRRPRPLLLQKRTCGNVSQHHYRATMLDYNAQLRKKDMRERDKLSDKYLRKEMRIEAERAVTAIKRPIRPRLRFKRWLRRWAFDMSHYDIVRLINFLKSRRCRRVIMTLIRMSL